MANPATELRRVTKRIAELQVQQRELIAQIGLDSKDEQVVLASLELTAEVQTYLDRVRGLPTVTQRRRAIALSRRLERAAARLERVPESDAKEAAAAAAAEVTERLLSTIFNA